MHDADLLSQFEACTLPGDLWTHRAHVRVAYLYLSSCPFEDAIGKLRVGIKRYNASRGVEESATSGYNETTTIAFAHIVAATIAGYGSAFPVSNSDEFCDTHPQLMSPKVLRLYYSPERRMHPDAKTRFVEPDLSPLPKIGSS